MTSRHQPAARVVANGVDITSLLLDKSRKKILVSLTVTDEAGVRADSLELVVDNREHFAVPPIGSEIEVWLGYEPAPERMGLYRLDHWEMGGPPSTLTLSATSAELTTEIRAAKTRSWNNATLKDIVQTIAGSHGLGTVMDGELAGRAVEHIDQQTESDIAFLSRLARRNGALFKVTDGKVIFAKKGTKNLPSGRGKTSRTIRPGNNVVTWSVSESERGGHKSVICYWHDHDAGKRKSVTAGSGKPAHRDKRLYRTEAEALAAASATLGDLKRGKREGQLELAGQPDLFAESEVTLNGFHPDADGSYNAKSVTHTFDSSGYRTSVSLEVGGDTEAD